MLILIVFHIKTQYMFSFVETLRELTIAKLSIRKLKFSSVLMSFYQH